MKYLTLNWPADGSQAEGRNTIRVVTDVDFELPTIEVEPCGFDAVNGRLIRTYRALIGGEPGYFVTNMKDAIVEALEQHFGLSAKGYKVRMVVSR